MTYKSKSPLNSQHTNLESSSKSSNALQHSIHHCSYYIHTSIWRNFSKPELYTSRLQSAPKASWLLNPGGKPLVPQCIEFIFEKGGSIFKNNALSCLSVSLISFMFFACVFLGQSSTLIPLEQHAIFSLFEPNTKPNRSLQPTILPKAQLNLTYLFSFYSGD